MPKLTLPTGVLHYEDSGPPTGRPAVFVHGYTMDSSLWRPLTDRLSTTGLRCITPTWPLGAHSEAMRPGTDLSLPAIAAMVDDALGALGLDDVVLVGADTGGVIAQLVAVHHPGRLGALVLTSCDAFENFPPPILKPFIRAAGTRRGFRAAVQPMRLSAVRRRAFGNLAHRDIQELAAAWVRPALEDPAVCEDLRRLTGSLETATTLDVGARLGEVTTPALIAWSADDELFPVDDGRRLADALPAAELHVIDGARTFSMLDQPDRLADLLATTARTVP